MRPTAGDRKTKAVAQHSVATVITPGRAPAAAVGQIGAPVRAVGAASAEAVAGEADASGAEVSAGSSLKSECSNDRFRNVAPNAKDKATERELKCHSPKLN